MNKYNYSAIDNFGIVRIISHHLTIKYVRR